MAMPLFGAGVGGLSIEKSLTTILDGLENSASVVRLPLKVEVVVWDQEDFDQARVVFNEYSGREARQAEENQLAEEALKKLLGN
jgi:hypothetical protein